VVTERRAKQLLVVSALLVGGLSLWTRLGPATPDPGPPTPSAGLDCFRQGGVHYYCDCLDRLESARAAAGRTATELPPLDRPLIRYAMQHPRLFPIINADTERCLTPPRVPPPTQPVAPGAPA
jgi:hypothetical protein